MRHIFCAVLALLSVVHSAPAQQLTLFTQGYAERYYTTDGFFVTLIYFSTDVIPVQLGHSVNVILSVDNSFVVSFPSQFQQVSSNRGGFFELWAYNYRRYSNQRPALQVAYGSSVTDTNTGQRVVDDNNGKLYQVELPAVKKLVRGIKSSNPLNQFTLSKFNGNTGVQYWLSGSVFAQVTPVEPGHSVNLFYRLHSQDAWSSLPMSWTQNQASSVDSSFLIHESWQYSAPIVLNSAPPVHGLEFEFYVVCYNSIRNETYTDNNGGSYYHASVRIL